MEFGSLLSISSLGKENQDKRERFGIQEWRGRRRHKERKLGIWDSLRLLENHPIFFYTD